MSIENQVDPSYKSLPPDLNDEPIYDRVAHEALGELALSSPQSRQEVLDRFQPTKGVLDVVWSGLSGLAGRKLAPERVKRDTHLIFAGLEKAATVYGLFVAPAAVISFYQSLLKVAGVSPDNAFPNGTWQFYVEYALREDTARHTVETHGFDSALVEHQIELPQVDRMAAWVMSAIYCLRAYDRLLQNEWRERIYLNHLREVMAGKPEREKFEQLYRQWEQERPYGRGKDAKKQQDYPAYRRHKFDEFLQAAMEGVPQPIRQQWADRVTADKKSPLTNYLAQMSILAYLQPDTYNEVRRPLKLKDATIALVFNDHYYLLPVVDPRTKKVVTVSKVRSMLSALVERKGVADEPKTQLAGLAMIQRQAWPVVLQKQLSPELLRNVQRLATAPILLNFDQRPSSLPLSQIRQGERGIGSHALTIFDTGKTAVFDLSHIFFDGIWGSGLAEILTNEALAWGAYLQQLPRAPLVSPAPKPLRLRLTEADWRVVQTQPRIQVEASAETAVINGRAIGGLRRLFKQRSNPLKLTVNDLLILYRAIHARTYEPNPALLTTLNSLSQREATKEAAVATLAALRIDKQESPAILIPVDASKRSPRERLHPVAFEVPLDELNILALHTATLTALSDYTKGIVPYQTFDELQREYLEVLVVMGEIFDRIKQYALIGESASVGSIKMLAHLPKSVQQLLNKIPERLEILNDILRGREVFSNIGAVVDDSTLSRFMTAKDDNEQKTLAWGVLTNVQQQTIVTLRDFRPHVGKLVRVGHQDLANRLTQDYLDSYAFGLNDFIHQLMRITLASRDTPVSTQTGRTNGQRH